MQTATTTVSSIAKVVEQSRKNISLRGLLLPEFCLLLCADVAQTEKKCAKKGKLIKIMDESERTDSRSGSTKTLSQG